MDTLSQVIVATVLTVIIAIPLGILAARIRWLRAPLTGGVGIVQDVVEPDPDHEGTLGYVIKIASWTEDQTQLRVHEPEVLPMSISLLPERKAG